MPDAAGPYEAIKGLPLFRWRGLEAPPYTRASFRITHNQAERPYARINGSGHDPTGRAPIPMAFVLYFVNGIEGRNDLFPALWQDWLTALDDPSAAELIHPLLGPVDARVLNFGGEIEAKTTGGIIIDVQFTDTVKDPTSARQLTSPQVNIAAVVDAAVAEASKKPRDFPSGESVTDLLNLLDQLNGLAFSIENDILGVVNKIKGIADKMITTVEKAEDYSHPDNIFIGHLQLIYTAVHDVGVNHGVLIDRATGTATLDRAMSIAQFANERSNTTAEIMQLNPQALGAPTLKLGGLMRYYL